MICEIFSNDVKEVSSLSVEGYKKIKPEKEMTYKEVCETVKSEFNKVAQEVPKTLLFKPDGSVIMLLDCEWDVENGIGVKLIPELVTGVQDLFLS